VKEMIVKEKQAVIITRQNRDDRAFDDMLFCVGACDKNELREFMRGIYVDGKTVVSTNGKMMCAAEIEDCSIAPGFYDLDHNNKSTIVLLKNDDVEYPDYKKILSKYNKDSECKTAEWEDGSATIAWRTTSLMFEISRLGAMCNIDYVRHFATSMRWSLKVNKNEPEKNPVCFSYENRRGLLTPIK